MTTATISVNSISETNRHLVLAGSFKLFLGRLDQGIAQFGARILELRRAGFGIENKTERGEDGTIHSWYRLISSPPATRDRHENYDESDFMRRQREEEERAMPLFRESRP
jgi:hypothetical protein